MQDVSERSSADKRSHFLGLDEFVRAAGTRAARLHRILLLLGTDLAGPVVASLRYVFRRIGGRRKSTHVVLHVLSTIRQEGRGLFYNL